MQRKISLAHLTVLDLSPPQVARVAAEAGFDSFGLRLHPVRPGEAPAPVRGDTPMRRELLAIMADTGVGMFDVEAFKLDENADFDLMQGSLEAAARLGAANALVFIDEPDIGKASDLHSRFCNVAADFGLDANLEFMPWLGISSLDAAIAVLQQTGCSNARLLFDVLHFYRAGTAIQALSEIKPSLLNYAQVCDAPLRRPDTLEGIASEARFHRMFPGEGELDLDSFIRGLPRDLPFAPEVATADIAKEVSGLERARRALQLTREAVERAVGAID